MTLCFFTLPHLFIDICLDKKSRKILKSRCQTVFTFKFTSVFSTLKIWCDSVMFSVNFRLLKRTLKLIDISIGKHKQTQMFRKDCYKLAKAFSSVRIESFQFCTLCFRWRISRGYSNLKWLNLVK